MPKNLTRRVQVGALPIGGGAPVSVQTMLNTKTTDLAACAAQAEAARMAGCDILRVAVPDEEAARALAGLVKTVSLPVVADIHFDHRLALLAVDAGVAKLRINPGNIGGAERVRAVAQAAMGAKIPIRIGVNGGSLARHLLKKFGGPTPQAMVESGLEHARLLQENGFEDIVISLKSSSVLRTVEAYQLMSQTCDFPLHIGVTEAGTLQTGLVASAAGLGILLSQEIGDTLRISLCADPVEEVRAGVALLRHLGLRPPGARVIACPTCGRCRVDVQKWAVEVETALQQVQVPITVAVMGCAVNGPGEAREADVGLAGGDGKALLFCHGETVGSVDEKDAVKALLALVDEALQRKAGG